MVDTEYKDYAGIFLQSTQQLRMHWSGLIYKQIDYTIAINAAIWSFFLKWYIDSNQNKPEYLVYATVLSAIQLGLWRLYTHYLDNHIAGLYPDFLFYENKLSRKMSDKYKHGTFRYLINTTPKLKPIFDSELTFEQKLKGISTLVQERRIGSRGHDKFDLAAFFIILIMSAISNFKLLNNFSFIVFIIICFTGIAIWFLLIPKINLAAILGILCLILILIGGILSLFSLSIFSVASVGLVGGIVGIFLILFGYSYYQKEPSEECIDKTIEKLKKEGRNAAIL